MANGASGYFGVYRGVVLNNADPEKLGRLILQVPTVLGNRQSSWASPSVTAGVAVSIPRPGDHVWVMFEGGSTDAPVWTGVSLDPRLSPDVASTETAWADITGKPETATRWPRWDEVTGKPTGSAKAFTMTVMGA